LVGSIFSGTLMVPFAGTVTVVGTPENTPAGIGAPATSAGWNDTFSLIGLVLRLTYRTEVASALVCGHL
jgi:hypothetical protein